MKPDYPAAHSMDTHWFAVDADGRVGLFNTGENGHAPDVRRNEDLFYDIWDFFRPADSAEDDLMGLSWPELTELLGLFFFEYTGEFEPIRPYKRAGVPDEHLHVDQLPPHFREECQRVAFPSLRFAEAERIQPLEFFQCSYWYDRVAYLAADGVTVCPIPGKEARFAEFVERFTVEHPDSAEAYRFAFPDQPTSQRSEP